MAEQAVKDRIAASGGWVTQRQLGRGQYGTAYLVEWSGGGTSVNAEAAAERAVGDLAVAKVVGLEFLPEKEHEMAFQEVKLMRSLRHPFIVSLIDHFLTENGIELVIVMDYCDCGDLRNEVKRRSTAKPIAYIPEPQIMGWFCQLTLALNYIHQRHILHRDLKSSNIFLKASTESHDLKIGDFGIARVLEGTVDVAATVVGTPYYMSPEVCKSEPYGYKSDIWALGCVLYEMCMLKHAFESQSLLGLVYKIVSETYDPIPEQYTEDLRTLLERVLDKSHYARPNGKDLIMDGYVRRFATGAAAAAAAEAQAEQLRRPSNHASPAAGASTAVAQTGHAAPAAAAAQGPRAPVTSAPQMPGKQQPVPSRSLAPNKGPHRGTEPTPAAPDAVPPQNRLHPAQAGRGAVPAAASPDEPPVRRQWCAQPTPTSPMRGTAQTPQPSGQIGGGPRLAGRSYDESELRAQVLLRRIQISLTQRRQQNWLQVFASFDRAGNGQLKEAEFEQAMTSMALGLSDAEIREVRAHLQGSGVFIPVDRFGAALHQASQEVLRLEDWGRSLFGELLVKAAEAGSAAGGVARGAHVRVQGLQSAVGQRLNGSEGIVDKWDSQACRWVVRLPDGSLKSIRDENLLVLRHPTAPGTPMSQQGGLSAAGLPDTTALYRLLCEGGDTAIPEEQFNKVLRKLSPALTEGDLQKLMLLLPKSLEGRVDIPEALAQFVTNAAAAEQTLRMGGAGPRLPNASPAANAPARARTQPMNNVSPGGPPGSVPSPQRMQPAWGSPSPWDQAHRSSPEPPGTVHSPRRNSTPAAPGSRPPPSYSLGGERHGSAPSGGGGAGGGGAGAQDRVLAEVALLRLAQRLVGGSSKHQLVESPGLDVLKLFSARADEVRLDELLDATSVLPLGISRAEVQKVFAHIRGSSGMAGSPTSRGDALPFALLTAAAKAAHAAGVPSEAAALERLDLTRLLSALRKLGGLAGGRASPQDFRFSLMQAEPYLTPCQLEWLMMLTDKDGEGRLLPRSLLARLCPQNPHAGSSGNAGGANAAALVMPPRPAGAAKGPVARNLPRSLVVSATAIRVRDRLRAAGPSLRVDRVLGLFELDTKQQLARGSLASLLAQLRLGISAAEADELINSLPAVGAGVGSVQLSSLFEALLRAESAQSEDAVADMREAVRARLLGRGDAFASAVLTSNFEEFIPEAEFRRCLGVALADVGLDEDTEDRMLLLADKNAIGDVRWRPFAQLYGRWEEPSDWGETTLPESPQKFATEPNMTGQSWRSMKAKEVAQMRMQSSPDKVHKWQSVPEEDYHHPTTKPADKRCGCVIS
eukprot:TRINITY_DN7828_c0_g1_i2.p1 TRINITY_DN7828_c0_g1~~TRINITY_DN7828_c0_g1_i2.p1  ORF type:complete len:1317 (-),score=283.86 TRINITY_DN7828_c0_g1_i2:119-4069(-)